MNVKSVFLHRCLKNTNMENRIKAIVEYSRLSTTNFADTIGISRSALVHLLSGRNQPSLDVLRKILNVFPEISIDWIMFGHGSMLRAGATVAEEPGTSAPESDNFRQTDLFGGIEDSDEVVSPSIISKPETVDTSDTSAASSQSASRPLVRKEKIRQTQEKKIVKIVFFYSDNTFEEFKKALQ